MSTVCLLFPISAQNSCTIQMKGPTDALERKVARKLPCKPADNGLRDLAVGTRRYENNAVAETSIKSTPATALQVRKSCSEDSCKKGSCGQTWYTKCTCELGTWSRAWMPDTLQMRQKRREPSTKRPRWTEDWDRHKLPHTGRQKIGGNSS